MKIFNQTTLFLFVMFFLLRSICTKKGDRKENNFAGKMVNTLFVEIPEAEEKKS
jgi:hypothetical protein